MDNSEKKLYLAKMVNVWKHVNSEGKEMCGTLSSLVELLSPVCFDFSVSEWRAQLFLIQAAVLEWRVIQFVA